MPREFILRGKGSGTGADPLAYQRINISGFNSESGFRLVEFEVWPSVDAVAAGGDFQFMGALSRCSFDNRTSFVAQTPDFNDSALIANAQYQYGNSATEAPSATSLINDLAILTQDLVLHTIETRGTSVGVNWQIRLKEVKLTDAARAVANYEQYSIYNTSQ